jgi:glycosyltransferase involved in cell wall biosynthesis
LCCYIDAGEIGGMETSLATLLAVLPSRFVVSVVGTSSEVLAFVTSRRPETTTHLLPVIRGKRDIVPILRCLWVIRQERPDLLHVSMGQLFAAQYALLAAVLTKTPTVAIVHGIIPRASRRKDVVFHEVMRRVQVVGGVSESVCRMIEDEYGRPRGSAPVLFNGIEDIGVTQVPVERGGRGITMLGAVGRCAPEKGFDLLLRALVELPHCHLTIVGEGAERNTLATSARELGISDRVRFTGWVDPPWPAHLAFDIVVVPSRSEGFGLVVVEALLAGMPVIGTRVGGLPDLIDDGVNGVLVDPEDPEALVQAIDGLVREPGRREELASHARASVLERYSTSALSESYARIFDDTLQR